MEHLTREQLKEQGFKKMLLGGANAQPYDWLHDSVFGDTIEIDASSQEYENDFIGILEDVTDTLICRVQWNENHHADKVFITPLNNNGKLMSILFHRLAEGNDEPGNDNYVYTLVEKVHLWSGPAIITFWKK